MNPKNHVTYRADDYAVVGEDRIAVTNWSHLGQPRQVEINWPSIGAVDIETAKRFVTDLQTAIAVAATFDAQNHPH